MIFLTILFLALMEISLSFDNAVINAVVLKDMSPQWQLRFLTWGMPIAVGGMRLLLPILIVCASAGLSPEHSLQLAYYKPEEYAKALGAARTSIDAFGGTFLLLIWLSFLFEEKEIYWLHCIESKLPKFNASLIPFKIIIGIIIILETFFQLGIPAATGFGLYVGMEYFMGNRKAIRSGFAAFLYLELIDASCSFDGVVGAFVLTNNILYIALGLGIGALCIRVLTLHLVKGGVLKEYIYLEHGAHYAIGILGAIMLTDIYQPVPEPVTGMCGVSIIGLSLLSSWRKNQQNKA